MWTGLLGPRFSTSLLMDTPALFLLWLERAVGSGEAGGDFPWGTGRMGRWTVDLYVLRDVQKAS